MRCGDCKHWDNKDPEIGGWFKSSDNIIHPPHTVGYCWVESPLIRPICDGEGIYGELLTHQDFGCILFEKGDGNKVNP